MKLSRLLCCAAALAALSVGVTACGGDDAATSKSTTTTAAKKKKSDGLAIWVNRVPPQLSEVGGRLQDAGYTVSSPKGQPDAPAVRVLMRAGGSAYVIVPSRKVSSKQVAEQVKSAKGRMAVQAVGRDVYLASSGLDPLPTKKKLTTAQLTEFEQIVAIGSGRS
ncbi:MAG: hypothetical protein WBC33_09895 [Conexibacter sp.]